MKKVVILAIVITPILIGGCFPARSFYSCISPEHKPLNNPHFKLLWSRYGIALYPNPFDASLQGIASTAFVITGQDLEYGSSKMLAFDTQSGNVLWQRNASLQVDMTSSNSQLFAGLYDKIEVIEPKTGKLVTTIKFNGVGSIYNLFAAENNLYAFSQSGRWLTYNIDDGTYNLSERFPTYDLFHVENGTTYLIENSKFKAKDSETQSVFWEYPVDKAIEDLFVTDNTIIVTLQPGSIYGLDKRTGKLLWKLNEHVISNITSNKSNLYFLTDDGYLKVFDMNTGQEITKLEFTPASFEPENPPSGHIIGDYNVWADSQKDIVIASFGDSCQLMALKLEPVEEE